MTVRIATIVDKPEVWRLFRQGHSENGLFPICTPKVEWWINRLLDPGSIDPEDTAPRGVIGVIGGSGDRLEAVSLLVVGEFWYTDYQHIEEFIVYVDTPCRNGDRSRAYKALYGKTRLAAIIDWNKEQASNVGLHLMTGVLSLHRTEAKVRLYERMLQKAGAFFIFNPTMHGTANGGTIVANSSAALGVHYG